MPRPHPVRIPLPRPIGFVLSGGGALGAVQVGMLRALTERGITPDLVVGTSIGAFNGAVLAADPHLALDKLTRFWTSSSRSDALSLRGVRPLLHWRRTRQSLYPNDGVIRGIRSVLHGYPRIEDLALPFGAVAVDVRRGLPEILLSGPLESALLASSAIPGIFPPVSRNGNLYYDGGIGDSVPIRDAVRMGAKSLVVLDTTNPVADLEHPKSLSAIASYVTEVYSRQSVLRHLEDFAHLPTLYPRSPASGTMSPLDLDHTDELMQQSYIDALAYLDMVLVAE
jgi:NTE family protein